MLPMLLYIPVYGVAIGLEKECKKMLCSFFLFSGYIMHIQYSNVMYLLRVLRHVTKLVNDIGCILLT